MRVLVTGASRGIGRAVCLRLAREHGPTGGLKLAACGASHGDELDSLVAELRRQNVEAVPLLGDLGDPEVPARLVGEAVAVLGGLDGVVSNAGIARPGTLQDLALEDWTRLFDVNLRATWLLARAARDELAAARGALVAVASMSGVEPQPGMGAYSVSKAALIMLTRLIALEWSGQGIRANCVSPGLVLTPMTEQAYADGGFRARREAMVPQGRIADPLDDIAGVVAFLLGPDAGYCTGQNIVADGGLSASILKHLPARTT